MASFAADIDAIFAAWNRPDSPGCAVLITVDGDALYAFTPDGRAYKQRRN